MVDQTQEINKKVWVVLRENDTSNTSVLERPDDMKFNSSHVVSISTYSVLMVLSGIANITVLYLIIHQRRMAKKKHSSMINTMLMHLAIADLLVTFLMMPLEIGWSATVSWWAGDVLCRIMSFFRIFGLYLSGFVLMCISVDRYYAVLKPLSLAQMKWRGKIMLTAAWVISSICSAPQMYIFHVERHPNFTDYEQCVTFHVFKSNYQDLAYKYFGFVMMYGLPLCVIIFCYTAILIEIYSKYKESNIESGTFRRSSAGYLGRARIRTLKMTITIVTGFIVCWTPYYVMCLWYWMDKASAEKVDAHIQKALFFFASANSLMNPIVYGIFNVRPTSPPRAGPPLKSSTIPDLVNSNTSHDSSASPSRKAALWRWKLRHRSLSSDHPESLYGKTNRERKKRFFLRIDTQRSFSSEGTDIADTTLSAISKTTTVPQTADIKRLWWQQNNQRPREAEENEGCSSAWQSHGRMELSTTAP